MRAGRRHPAPSERRPLVEAVPGVLPRPPRLALVAGLPASIHRAGDALANAYISLFPTLATDLADPVERLRAIRDSARREKSGRRPTGGEGLLSEWVDIAPPWLYGVLARLYVDGHFSERLSNPFFNLLVSSVPGPSVPLRFAGATCATT